MGIIFNFGHAILRQTLTQIQFRREAADQEIVWNHVIKRMTKETKGDRAWRGTIIPLRYLKESL